MRRPGARAAVLAVPAALALLDLVVRREALQRWSASQHLAWLLSASIGAAAWLLAVAAVRPVYRRFPRTAMTVIALASLAGTFSVFASFIYYLEFAEYPTWSELAFLVEEADNLAGTVGLMAPWLTAPILAAIGAGAGLVSVLIVRALRAAPARPKHSRGQVALTAVLCLSLVGGRATLGNVETPNPPDSNLLVSASGLAWYYLTRSKGAYYASERRAVPALEVAHEGALNVLFVVHESLGSKRMSLYGHARKTTPRLEQWLEREPEALVVFRNAYTNSGNTSVVLPELLTGLAPSATLEQLHEAPFLWQYARAAGYRTLLLSAQSFRYASFAEYFLSTPPERVFTADEGVELVNGGGMDDRVFAERVSRELDLAIEDSRPFFAVVQYNATHHPILKVAPYAPEFAGSLKWQRYENAIVLVDELIDRLRAQLEARGVLERTVIIVTSDHGENMGEHRRHRTQSYYEEVLAIPILMYLPAELRKARPDAARSAHENASRLVQNLDLAPTALDALGLLEEPALAKLLAPVAGTSLLRPVAPDRVLYALNNTAARRWTNEGFALLRNGEKYIFSERDGHEYYELARDPEERRNRWPELGRAPSWVPPAIRADQAYVRILQRHTRAGDPLRQSVQRGAAPVSPVPRQ